MKRLYLIFLALACFSGNATGQDTTRRKVDIGIDLLKNAWPLIGSSTGIRTAITVEPTLILQLNKPARYLHITPGFTSFSSQSNDNKTGNKAIDQSGHGYYLKVGHERRMRKIGVGAALLLSAWEDEGNYQLRGSYFGDYTGEIPRQTRIAIGSEIFVGGLMPLSNRLALRIQFRVNILAPYTSYDQRPAPAYLPGVGLVAGDRWAFGEGVSLQLIYRASRKDFHP